jgi:superfamily II DNA or RNA helicase
MKYEEFISSKAINDPDTGFDVSRDSLNKNLFDFQRDIVRWSLKKGRACIFADCGMGKTLMQLEWASKVADHTNNPVLILAPLAVSHQTIREGEKFGISVSMINHDEYTPDFGIHITNYEKIHKVDLSAFGGIVLDESSILKDYTGKLRNAIIEQSQTIPFRLACTATPAPNDFMELGNHSEFVGSMSRTEMLSMFFVHDGGETQKWRLKGHAKNEFWKWVCSWAVMISKPSDLGYSDDGYILPKLTIHNIVTKVEECDSVDGFLFRLPASSLSERQKERKLTIDDRAKECAGLINANTSDQWLVWCNLNDEAKSVKSYVDDIVEVSGSDKDDVKTERMLGFSSGEVSKLVTKPKIAGHGMNWQNCNNIVFVGLSDSYEQYYQAIRRCWRFGQTKDVNCYIITAETEGAVVANIERKERDAMRMAQEMVANMHVYNEKNIKENKRDKAEYNPKAEMNIPSFI